MVLQYRFYDGSSKSSANFSSSKLSYQKHTFGLINYYIIEPYVTNQIAMFITLCQQTADCEWHSINTGGESERGISDKSDSSQLELISSL